MNMSLYEREKPTITGKDAEKFIKKALHNQQNMNTYVPEYSQIHYNEVILWLEQLWNRKLSDHEKNVLIQGYRFGRLKEMENYTVNNKFKNMTKEDWKETVRVQREYNE
jgi:hypothetical protein